MMRSQSRPKKKIHLFYAREMQKAMKPCLVTAGRDTAGYVHSYNLIMESFREKSNAPQLLTTPSVRRETLCPATPNPCVKRDCLHRGLSIRQFLVRHHRSLECIVDKKKTKSH